MYCRFLSKQISDTLEKSCKNFFLLRQSKEISSQYNLLNSTSINTTAIGINIIKSYFHQNSSNMNNNDNSNIDYLTKISTNTTNTSTTGVSSSSSTFTSQNVESSPTLPSPSKNIDYHLIRINNITKSQQDNREYRGLQLNNGLKVLLVSDSTANKSAASLSVYVGHMNDPDNIAGLSHFLEHMLFLGTEKYPDENSYSSYLQQHGGSSNAETYPDKTKFYFDVLPKYLEGALDRFAQFFIAPLFNESAVEREINAVESEHDQNIAIDSWRIRQINKHLSKQDHRYNNFGTGNKSTLEFEPKRMGINIRDELIKFHKQWYSSNIMSLCVSGKNTLDELEEMVLPRFALIQNKNKIATRWNELPFSDDQLQKKIYVVPVKDTRTITISFQCGDLEEYFRSVPEQYLQHLIGHEGRGSILSELKNRGWCDNLVAGHSTIARGFGFFDITVDLTEDGLNKIDDIIKIIFQYIKFLRQDEPKKWIFDEYRKLMETQFKYKDKEQPISLVAHAVEAMEIYPFEEVLSAPDLISEWRPDLIKQLVNEFLPERCRILVVAQKFEPIAIETEKWYNSKYCVEQISQELLDEWTNCDLNENFKLPEPNPYIATDFMLYPIDSDVQQMPTIIYDTPIQRVWFKQDTEFLKPKTDMNFDFSSPLAYSDPLNCVSTNLFITLFKDDLTEYLYEAELAKLHLNVVGTAVGISLSINGYTHKQQLLLQKILDHLFIFKFNENRFHILKAQMLRALKYYKTEQPYQRTIYYIALLLTEHAWSKADLIDAMQLLTPERLTKFIQDLLSRVHVECFVHGNCNKQRALELSNIIEQKLNGTNALLLPLLSRQLLLKREYKLDCGKTLLFQTDNTYHKSSCVQLYLQFGVQSDYKNALLDLIVQIISEPCYNVLRTQEQLGYIVHCSGRKSNGTQGLRIIVQSSKHPIYVAERIELFLINMIKELKALTDDEFQRHRDALIAQKLEKPKHLSAAFNQFLSEIIIQQYHFERNKTEVGLLKTIIIDDLIEYYSNYVVLSAPKRQALLVYIISTVNGCAGNKYKDLLENYDNAIDQNKLEELNAISDHLKLSPSQTPTTSNDDLQEIEAIKKCLIKHNNMTKINDLVSFKSSKELYPIIQPFINIQPKGGKCKL